MSDTLPKTAAIQQNTALSRVKSLAGDKLNLVLNLVDDKFKAPLEISLTGAILTVGPSKIQTLESDGAGGTTNSKKLRIPVVSGIDYNTASSTLNFSTGATTGDFKYPSDPGQSVTSGYYIQMGVALRSDKKLYIVWGIEAASLGNTTAPAFSDDDIQVLVVPLLNNGTPGAWQFVTPVFSAFETPAQGGGGGGGGASDVTLAYFKDRLNTSDYALANPILFALDKDTKFGTFSGTLDYVNKAYSLNNTQQIITNNLLGESFLNQSVDLDTAELELILTSDINTLTAEVTRNGVDYTAVTLTRELRSGSYLGSLSFTEESTNRWTQAISNTQQELSATPISIGFTVANKGVIKSLTLPLVSTGSPIGSVQVQILDGSSNIIWSSAYMLIANYSSPLVVSAIVPAGSYTIKIIGDATYLSTFSTGVTSVKVNASTVSIAGRTHDLRIRLISGIDGVLVKGMCVYYCSSANQEIDIITRYSLPETSEHSSDFVASINTAHVINSSSVINVKLPQASKIGDRIDIFGKGVGGWKVVSNETTSSQYIVYKNFKSAISAFNVVLLCYSINQYDSVSLVCIDDNSGWEVLGTTNASIATNYYGDGSDGSLSTSGNVTLTSALDGDMVVKNYKSLTINSGHTLTVSNRCKGLFLYVDGDLTINSTGLIAMTGKGANVNPVTAGVSASGIRLARYTAGDTESLAASDFAGCGASVISSESRQPFVSKGKIFTILREGANGAPSQANNSYKAGLNGSAGTSGQSGGGGGGATGDGAGGQYSGAGSAGTCFSGGAGGGGAYNDGTGTAGGANGGAGGNGNGGGGTFCGGGAGNPAGSSTGSPSSAAQSGTGGTLIIVVRGNIINNGTIASNGSNGAGYAGVSGNASGGASGGGNILILRSGTYSGSGSITANGGAGGAASANGGQKGGDGGSGSIQTYQIL